MFLKKITKIINIILVLCIFMQAFPVYALALESQETAKPITDIKDFKSNLKLNTKQKSSEIVEEIVDKRELSRKYYRMNDGTTLVTTYPEAVHYKHDNKLKAINNDLQETESVLENKANSYKVKYEKTANSKQLYSVEMNGHEISWSLINGSAKANKEKLKTGPKSRKGEAKADLKNRISVVKYNDILKGVDLKYENHANSVKEYIILNNNKASKQELNFNFKLSSGLTAKINKQESIDITNEKGEFVFAIDRPFMYDAEYNLSDGVKYKLEDNNDGNYNLLLVLDDNWLKTAKYPVTIDPTTTTTQATNQIQDVFIYNGDSTNPATTRYQAHILRIGSSAMAGVNKNPVRSLIKFTLPSLQAGDQVVDAKLNVVSYPQHRDGYAYPTRNIQIMAHKMNVAWTSTNAYWSNAGGNSYDPVPVDYKTYTYNTTNPVQTVQFNITPIAKDWYLSGQNNGLVLKELNEIANFTESDAYFLSSDTATTYTTLRPSVTITYRNQTGLLDFMDYKSSDVGRAGTININSYNGNVVHTRGDASTPGGLLPVSVNHVYNSNDKNINIGFGNGQRLNLSETIENTAGGIDRILTDEDGTRHAFKSVNGIWVDEDGLELEFIPDGVDWHVKDKDGNEKIYQTNSAKNKWYLRDIYDSNRNHITILRDPNNLNIINKVTDGAGQELNFTYENGLLKTITDKAARVITYNYVSNNLTSVTYPDNETVYFEYSNNNLTKVQNIDNSANVLEYYPGLPNRVKNLKEQGSDGGLGNTLNFDYKDYSTVVTDNKNYKQNYIFNTWGQTTSITDNPNNNPNEMYGTSSVFDNTLNSARKNKLLSQSALSKPSSNLLLNHSFETTEIWELLQWGNIGDGACAYGIDQFSTGKRSLKCTNSKVTGNTVARQTLANVPKGKTYTISGKIKTLNVQGDGGAQLRAIYYDVNGVQKNIMGEIVKGTTDWKRYIITFELPANATTGIYLINRLVGVTGTAWFDDIQLEESEIANNYNLLQNGNFEKDGANWIGTATDANDKTVLENGNKIFKINGTPTGRKNIRQKIELNGKAGDTFKLEGFIRNNGSTNSGSRLSDITFSFYNTADNWAGTVYFSPNRNTWQYFSHEVVAPVDYAYIVIYVCHYYQSADLSFDNLALYKDITPTKYTYDSKGNIVKTEDGDDVTSLLYDTNNQVTNITDNTGESADFEYDPVYKSRLIKSVSDSVTTRYSYDSFGNNIKTKNEGTDGQYIEANTEYDSTGRYITKTFDERNKETSNTYNLTRGTLSSTTNANNISTNYEYDIMDRLTGVTSKDKTNNYIYSKDKLTTINHHNMNYNFVYDVFGNVNSIKINNNPLITNYYESNNGSLLSSTYGNNQTISNTYDNFNRLSTIINSSGTTTYKYDNRNNISSVIAPFQTLKFEYDINNRLISHNENNLFSINYAYDSSSNVSKLYQLGTNTYATSDVKDSNSKITKTNIGTNSINYTYDSLNRTNTRMIKHGTKEYNTNYTFLNIDDNRTTNILKTIKNGNNEITYTYDNIGNIKSIKYNDTITQQYTYDDQNQLSIDMNPYNTINYNYDGHGNITSKEIYNPDTDTVTTINYEYNNSNWTDQLTKYNGNTITYDEIGNPLTYGSNIAYTWQNGRELSNYTDTSKNLNVSYKYNSDGIRLEKTVNGVTTKYYLEGNKVIYEETNGDIIRYTYDSNDNLVSLNYNNNEYYYVYNGTNDIIGLLDSNLELVVKYEYDSFGKVINIKDANNDNITSNTHIGKVNPYRYKSYRYDTETELYYLQSRYYNPDIGRFINADDIEILYENQDNIIENNLYTYVLNNPINMNDSDGEFAITLSATYAIAYGAVALGAYLMTPQGKRLTTGIVSYATNAVGGTNLTIKSNVSQASQKSNKPKKQKKQSKKSGKAKSSDTPSWAKGEKPQPGENGKQFAQRLMDKKYGKGKWSKSNREYTKIQKNGDRGAK